MGLSGIYRHDIVVVGMPVVARPIIVHGERLRCQLTTMLAGCTVDFKDQMQNECKAAACFAHKIEIGSSAVCVGHVSGPKGKVTVSHSCLAMVDTVPLNEDGSLHVESSHKMIQQVLNMYLTLNMRELVRCFTTDQFKALALNCYCILLVYRWYCEPIFRLSKQNDARFPGAFVVALVRTLKTQTPL